VESKQCDDFAYLKQILLISMLLLGRKDSTSMSHQIPVLIWLVLQPQNGKHVHVQLWIFYRKPWVPYKYIYKYIYL